MHFSKIKGRFCSGILMVCFQLNSTHIFTSMKEQRSSRMTHERVRVSTFITISFYICKHGFGFQGWKLDDDHHCWFNVSLSCLMMLLFILI